MSRYGGIKGKIDFRAFKQQKAQRLIGDDVPLDNIDEFAYNDYAGVWDLSDTQTYDPSEALWPIGAPLTFSLDTSVRGYLPPAYADALAHWSSVNPTYNLSSILTPYATDSSIVQIRIPIGGNYQFTVAGASGQNRGTRAYAPGRGAIIRATYTLAKGTSLWLIIGQRPAFSNSAEAWQGGAGGSFICIGSTLPTSEPLLVAGGGGGGPRTSNPGTGINVQSNSGQMNTWAHLQQTVNSAETTIGGRYGGRGGGGGLNALSGTSDAASAGFYVDGTVHTDNRRLPVGYTHSAALSARNGAIGGTFLTTYDNNYSGHGGFGCGGPGGWGGAGAGGGYSGGGNGRNSTSEIGGGGGSFIADSEIAGSSPTNVGTSDGSWSHTNRNLHPTAPWPAAVDNTTTNITGLDVLGYNGDPLNNNDANGYIIFEKVA